MVYLPLWKIWKSVGIILPNIWKIKTVPNHQPDNLITVFRWGYKFYKPTYNRRPPSSTKFTQSFIVTTSSLAAWSHPRTFVSTVASTVFSLAAKNKANMVGFSHRKVGIFPSKQRSYMISWELNMDTWCTTKPHNSINKKTWKTHENHCRAGTSSAHFMVFACLRPRFLAVSTNIRPGRYQRLGLGQ